MQTKSYGNNCHTAIVVNTINYNYNFTDYTMPDINLFLKFTADTSALYLIIAKHANTASAMAALTANFEGPNGCYFHVCCGYMWDGITINNSTNNTVVSFYNKTAISWIEDAEHAIYVNGQAQIKPINLVFNKNHMGILFENSAGFSNSSIIYGSNFQCNNLVNMIAQTCIPPNFGQRANIGTS